MITMHITGLTIDSVSKAPLVVLQDEAGRRLLPLLIGATEAMTISLSLNGQTLTRPLTHELLVTTIVTLGGQIDAVEIYITEEGALYASIIIQQGTQCHTIDARPSDALALALRATVPIKVHPQVLQTAAVKENGHTNFRVLNTLDNATDMMRRATPSKNSLQNSSLHIQQSSTLHEKNTTDSEQKLKKLLQHMVPASSRRM